MATSTRIREFPAESDTEKNLTLIEIETAADGDYCTRSIFDWQLLDRREVYQDDSGSLRILDTDEVVREV
jgi:hypothetical protein